MHYLEQVYGNDGYATWFKIIERLGKSDLHYIDLSDEVQLMFLSSKCNIKEETLIEIIQLLVKFNWLDRSLWEEKRIVFSPDFVESIKDAYKKRSNEPICITQLYQSLGMSIEGLGVTNQIKGDLTPPQNPKEKKRKEKNTTTTKRKKDLSEVVGEFTMSQKGTLLYKPHEAVEEIRKDDIFIESFMNGSPPAKFVFGLLQEPPNGKSRFERHCIQSGEEMRSLKLYKNHLTNWARKLYNELSPSQKAKYKT